MVDKERRIASAVFLLTLVLTLLSALLIKSALLVTLFVII